ncbi:hypothetical protein [Vibrio phage V-YDF132]|nr:hypothetical protein [Vibrio phage V-YDF132]
MTKKAGGIRLYNRNERRASALDSIIAEHSGKDLQIFFVGAFAGGGRRAKIYKYTGKVTQVEDRVHVSGETVSRHYSKVIAVIDPESKSLLFGRYCRKCQTAVPAKYGNCPSCCGEIIRGKHYS